ncbi:MAG: universal stress protein [Actinobacteria bacterium]|nr:universal stress protein [Actinomycetota bacterium]
MNAVRIAPQHVTVGVDGSIESHAALLWAVDHARPGDTVHLVHAWQPSHVSGVEGGDDDTAALRMVGREVARARRLIGDQPIAVSGELVHGAPGARLAEIATDLVVIGTRDHHLHVDALPGSVCRQLLRHSPVPIVVVPDRHRRAAHRSNADRAGDPA